MSNFALAINPNTPMNETHLWRWLAEQSDLSTNTLEILWEYRTQADYQGVVVVSAYVRTVLNHFLRAHQLPVCSLEPGVHRRLRPGHRHRPTRWPEG